MDAALIARVLDLAVAIQQIPAPPFGEAQRAAFLRERFLVEGLQDVSIDDIGNVYGRLPGQGQTRPLVVSAHLDTVFPYGTDLQVQREADKVFGPGIGDNSLGLAGLFGLLWALRQQNGQAMLPGDLWLVGNVGEEGLGDLRGMRAVVDRFGDSVCAYVILEGMALGQIYHRGLGVQRYRITANTDGGHSWVDYGKPSAIHELCNLTTRLTALPVPAQPRSSLNVGVIAGGTSVNTIAAEAHLELDLRSENSMALSQLVRQVEALVSAANRADVVVTLELIGRRPAGKLASSHPLVRLAKRCLQAQGIRPNLTIGSTDANVPLSRGLPAICIGLSTGYGAHTVNEYIHVSPLFQGLAQLLALVEGIFQELCQAGD
jgi:acetylornithine deacetylase/succinyl-diaminopimelate desuccinylase-like protein